MDEIYVVIMAMVIFVVVCLITHFIQKRNGQFDEHIRSRKYDYSIYVEPIDYDAIYGPLTLADEKEVAWPAQSISIKYPDDNYTRWADINKQDESIIKWIGSAPDCWLRIEDSKSLGVRPYHMGLVRCRGRYYIFELNLKLKDPNSYFEWWNAPYKEVPEAGEFKLGNIDLVIYRHKRPMTIEGKNTDGVAIINTEKTNKYSSQVIGSAPDCWITLPDPDLPAYMAVRRRCGHHRVLYEYGYELSEDPETPYITRADKAFELGGYYVTLNR